MKGLKQRLTQLHGLPTRFRPRVLFNGENLKDEMTLDYPLDLELVLLTFADVSQSQMLDLEAAATQGSISQVGSLKQQL